MDTLSAPAFPKPIPESSTMDSTGMPAATAFSAEDDRASATSLSASFIGGC